ncbi:WLM domain-containing protein [Cytidiella melzeri]|nr:WLM domain-containing protein [Cytidiella melzeri]
MSISTEMVHHRLNEREANPNPYVNFIVPLPVWDAAAQENARQLLRALMAQVNSIEKYQYNKVFLGCNWNSNKVIVLRNATGNFRQVSSLLGTLCHDHMNHGPAFQALWAQLCREVKELQNKGYYGDGYWSSGEHLGDSVRVGSQGLDKTRLPEYMCGGAHSQPQPSSLQQRRPHGGPLNHTGCQTTRKHKAGSRVTAQGTFNGVGRALDEHVEDESIKKAGAGFRKQAGSKKAREAHAIAAERWLLALQSQTAGTSQRQVLLWMTQIQSLTPSDQRQTKTDNKHFSIQMPTQKGSENEQVLTPFAYWSSTFIYAVIGVFDLSTVNVNS